MQKYLLRTLQYLVVCLSVSLLFSCNNSGEIPFPVKQLADSFPQTVPLVLSAEKQVTWDTSGSTTIHPVVKHLDLNSLPAQQFDSTGFKPFVTAPQQLSFSLNTLPSVPFDLDKLPVEPLKPKTVLLPPQHIEPMPEPVERKDKALAIYDFGQKLGFTPTLVTSLFRDRDGMLWIGALEGLFRYDGTYMLPVLPANLNPIIAPAVGICQDQMGRIWFYQGGELGVVNLHKGTIQYCFQFSATRQSLSNIQTDSLGRIWLFDDFSKSVCVINTAAMTFQRIASQQFQQSRIFQVIPARQNRIWISTLGKGIYIYDPHAGKLYNFNKAQTLPVDTVSALAADNSGRIWAATTIGLLSLDPAKNTLTRYTEQQGVSPATRTLTIFTAVPDQIWVGGVSGIDVLNLRQATYRHITPGDGLQGNVVTSFDRDLFGNVWYATTTGMGRINAEAATVHPLGPTQIVSQMEDAKKDLWVALQRGLYVVDSTRKTMRLLTKAEGLSDNFVQSFTRNGDSMLVTSDGGYNIYDPVKKELTLVGKDQGLIHDTVYVLFMDRSGNFWLTGPGAGISKIDPVTHRVSRLDITGGLNDNSIMDIKEDSRGLIWLATNHNGVDILDPVRGTIRYLTNQPGLSDICNRNLFADSKGNVWIGTDKGIYVANTRNKTLTILTTRQGLNNDLILSLLPYQHKVLASTGTGISIIEAPATDDAEHSWKISPLSNSEGLIKSTNSWATDAVTADGQYLWGDLGITMFSQIKPSEDSSFPAINGLTIMSQPMYFLNKPDALLRDDSLRTTAGTKFTSRELDSLGFASPEVFQWDSVAGPYNLPVHLVLPYNQNYLQFQFLEPGQSRLIKPEFTYILQGIDKKWSKPTTNNYSENYLNLPSGDYTFMVSSKGPDHKWSKPAEFHFRITPPWYQSWWVYTLLILLGIILLRVYIGYRSRMLQKENRVLEEKVQERTHQLQQSLEDLKATQSQLIQAEKMASLGELTAGIAHEIQNPLNFVNNFSEINMELIDELKETLDKTVIDPEEKTSISSLADDIRQNQEKINYHGKRADAIVKGMLQHSRNSSGQKELTDINALADEYLRLAFHGLRAKDKSFNAKMVTDFDQSLEKISIIPQDMGRVILNLITNAFYAVTDKKKHAAPENYEPTVTVTTKKLKGKVEIKVSDNGNGIPKRVLDKIFQPFFTTKPTGEGTGLGLSLSYDIVKTHGGEILVDTREGEGTTFIINLPV